MVEPACLRCGAAKSQPLLQGSDRLYGVTNQRFCVVLCSGCGMARLSPRPDAADLGRYYPADYWFDPAENTASRLAEAYRRWVLRDHIGFVLQSFRRTSQGRVLDVGCGGGLLAGLLKEKGLSVIGFDSSAAACSLAWRRHRVPAVTGDLSSHPFKMGSFCQITLFHVVEHLADPAAYFAAARQLLEPGGRLIVQVPNIDSWQFRWFGGRWNGIDIPRHLNHFRPADLGYILGRSGFEVVRWKHFNLRDNPAGLATTLAPQLDPMARRIRGRRSNFLHYAAYLGLVAGSVPFALLEAAFGHGSTIMVDARPI